MGITAQRLALSLLRRQAAETRVKAAISTPTHATANEGELALIRQRYRDAFQEAFNAGLALPENRERMVFRMRVVDDLDVEQIAKVYGVNRSTVTRWLARARETVLSEARRILHERLELTASWLRRCRNSLVDRSAFLSRKLCVRNRWPTFLR